MTGWGRRPQLVGRLDFGGRPDLRAEGGVDWLNADQRDLPARAESRSPGVG